VKALHRCNAPHAGQARALAGRLCRDPRRHRLVVHQAAGQLPAHEDQGYFLSIVQLPAGATRERSLEVLESVEKHYLAQKEVAHVIGVLGFSFFGRGQNAAITFVRLKSWDERPNKENSAESVVQRANMAFFRIKQAMIFAINVPPIPELAAVGGFDFRLQDRGGLGRDKLLEARNMALGLASQNPALAGVRPEGQEAGPQVYLTVDRVKARALGIDLGDLNDTLQATLGTAYINDFVREGRILRVQMQAEADTRRTPDDLLRLPVKNGRGDMIPLAEIATAQWIVGSPKLDRYNGLPSMKIAGNPAPGRSTGEALLAMEDVASQAATRHRLRMVGQLLRGTALRHPGALPVCRLADRGLPVPRRAVRKLVDSLRGDAGGAAGDLRRGARRAPARPAQRRVFQGRPDRHHRPFGEERDPDHRVRPRTAGAGQGSDRGHAGSMPPALPADPDDLDRLHVRRAAAGGIHRRRRQQPPSPSAPASSAACSLPPCWRYFWSRYFSWWCAASSPATPATTRRRMMRTKLLPLAVALALGACSFIPEYQRPAAPVPDAWPALQPAAALGDSGRVPTKLEWREYFPDPRLQALIAAALEHNRDLRIALARVEEARAQAGIARADRFPQIDLAAQRAASLTPADLSATNRQLNAQRYDVNLGVSAFELDFWGRVKSLDDAARANFLASDYAQQSFRLSLIADVASAYFCAIELQERPALAAATPPAAAKAAA
jgi:hypothetical protein